nr:M20 aminoacylase family protein [Falsochrobactrum sp. TDYN1]
MCRIFEFKDDLVSIRREIHRYPEIGFEEKRTSKLVVDSLTSWGVTVHTGIGKTGVVGVLQGNYPGKKMVGLRADMDALPMEEKTNLPYASAIPGQFHGCGHDGHTAILLGAARYLAETRNFAGTAVFIFQPAEEGLGGARAMIKDELFTRFPCDEIYGLHNSPNGMPNRVLLKAGPTMAGADFFDIHIKGQGSHAAKPEASKDPILIASNIVQMLHSIVSRNIDPMKAAVLSVTQIQAGTAYNIIPEDCKISGTIRYLDRNVAQTIRQRMTAIAAGIEASFGVEVTVDLRNVFDVLINDADLIEECALAAADVVGRENVAMRDEPVMGSEDFADMLRIKRGVYLHLGHGGTTPVHNSGFILDEDIIPVGASIFSRLVERRLAK